MTNRTQQVQPYLVPVSDVPPNPDTHPASVIWGAAHRDRTISSGLFVCPVEGVERAYWTHRVRNWFHIIGLPVVPGARVGEYVECFACGNTYDPRLPAAQHPALGNLRRRQ